MAIDPQIKNITLDASDLARLRAHLTYTLEMIEGSRSGLEQDWIKWRRMAEAKPMQSVKSFPWQGAANIEVPLIAITANAIIARLYNTVFSTKPLWTVRARKASDVQAAESAQLFLEQMAGPDDMDMERHIRNAIQETVYMGVSHTELPWEIEYSQYREYDDQYQVVEREREVYAGVRPFFIPLEDMFLLPGRAISRHSDFKAHRFYRTWSQIRNRVLTQGWIEEETEKFKGQPDEQVLSEEEQKRLEGIALTDTQQEWTFYKFWTIFEINGLFQPLMGIFHRKSEAIVRLTYPMYFDGEEPWEAMPYLPRAGRESWLGLCEMLWPLQEALSTAMNQYIDNATAANTRVWAYRKNRQLGNNLKIWPGRAIALDDVNDLKPLQLGEVYPSGQIIQTLLREYAERRSGVADYQLGRESDVVKTRATATGTMALVQEGNRLFDLETRDLRRALGRMGRKAFARYQQFKPGEQIMLTMEGDEQRDAMQVFTMPTEYMGHRLQFEIGASTAQINRSIENQNLQALIPMTMQYYSQLAQAFQMIVQQQPGPMRELLIEEVRGGRELMARLYDTHEIRDADDFIPDIDDILKRFDKGGGFDHGGASDAGADRGSGAAASLESLFGGPVAGADGAHESANGGSPEGGRDRERILAGAA